MVTEFFDTIDDNHPILRNGDGIFDTIDDNHPIFACCTCTRKLVVGFQK